jgi:hypothetical protein
MKKTSFILIAALLFLSACKGHQSDAVSKDKYESSKMTIEEIESKNPVRFLSVSGSDKRNLIGQTVVKATVTSSAKVTAYKDIDVKLAFFSKTGALLEEDHEVIYEVINPGETVKFKSKYFAPKGTDNVTMKVVGASPNK